MRDPCDGEEDFGPIADEDAFDEAVARLKRGDLPEALIWLSRSAPELDDLPRLFDRHVKQALDAALATAATAPSTRRRAA